MNILIVSGINEVSASPVEGVEQLEARLFVALTHAKLAPLVADAHCTEGNWGDMNTCERRELAMTAELGGGSGGRSPESHCCQ